jgi:hypothetical protein
MEYVMVYLWVILAFVVVGVVMWQLGILNIGDTKATTSSGFARIKPQITETSVISTNGAGYYKIAFTNVAGGPIILADATVTHKSTTCSATIPAGTQGTGGNFDVTGTCPGLRGDTGDFYELHVTITYNVSMSGSTAQRKETGSVSGPLG